MLLKLLEKADLSDEVLLLIFSSYFCTEKLSQQK
jgi:hypothetical protein